MSATKHGQGAATAAPEPTRTPERQALADAIVERDRREGILTARRKIVADLSAQDTEANTAYYLASDELSKQTRQAEARQRTRTEYLLNGEEPPTETPIEELQAAAQRLDDERAKVRADLRQAEADVEALAQHTSYAAMTVNDCVTKAIHADPATLAVANAYRDARERFHKLQRALGSALNVQTPGSGPPAYMEALHFPMNGRSSLPPCIWAEAIARLQHDPDAVIPMPDAV